jgi:hypothetical protein
MMMRLRQVLVGSAAAILCYQLMLPPVVGLADNGDFGKVLGRFNLWAKVHKTYLFCDTVYEFHPDRHWVSDFYSTEIPLAAAAIALNSVLSKDGNFDLRAIGVVHSALFLLALWLLAPLLAQASRRMQVSICALVLLFYCDAMYVTGLNSFYMDEPTYLFLLLSVVFYLRAIHWHRPADAVGLVVCTVLMTAAKTQHALLAFWIALLLVVNGKLLWPGKARWPAAIAILPMAVALFMMTKALPWDYAGFPVYNVTFTQILPHAKNPDRTMADLGLDTSYRQYIGKGAYWAGSGMDDPAFERAFSRRLSLGKLAMFYLRHPRDSWQTLTDALNAAGRQRDFGDFDVSAGHAPLAESRAFRWWSDVKRFAFFQRGHRFLWTIVALSATLAALLYLRRRVLPPGAVSGGYVLIGMTFTELALSSLADSMDIVRHHLIFYALFDMVLLATVAVALAPTTRTSGIRKESSVRE